MNSKMRLSDEQQFFDEISELLQVGREVAYRSVNSVMVKLIGKLVSVLSSKNRMVKLVQIMAKIWS